MVSSSRQQQLESILALNQVLYGDEDSCLNPEEARTNVESNVIRLGKEMDEIDDGKGNITARIANGGSGLLITTDGHILTAAHVIEEWIDDWEQITGSPKTIENKYRAYVLRRESLPDRKSFPLDTSFHYHDFLHDIALIKAKIPLSPQPIPFQFDEERGAQENYRVMREVTHLTRNNEEMELKRTVGHIFQSSVHPSVDAGFGVMRRTFDLFDTSLIGHGGDSGSPILGDNKVLMGIAVTSTSSILRKDKRGTIGCAKIEYALDLIQRAVYEETKKIL
ncbi:trypsin-like peptidase domain-containing protein [Candidatus Woesearchaeota archaeon]|nr:trypsin-like peptidase domain-containing protein [Candidatus Woesearchaeota archaeon]